MEILATRIRQLRDSYDLSLERFARKVDVSTKSISTWEKDAGDPELKSLVQLAQACSVSTDWLLGLTDDPAPTTGAGAAPGRAAGRTEASDEVAVEGDARKEAPRPKRPRRGSARRPGA